MIRKTIAAIVAASMLAGCATSASNAVQGYTPIVDPAIGNQAALSDALAECRSLAQQIDQSNAAAAGAIAGAVLATALGAMLGARGSTLAQIAGSGALISGAQSAGYAGMTQAQIVQRCLTNRGYSVLG